MALCKGNSGLFAIGAVSLGRVRWRCGMVESGITDTWPTLGLSDDITAVLPASPLSNAGAEVLH